MKANPPKCPVHKVDMELDYVYEFGIEHFFWQCPIMMCLEDKPLSESE